VRETILPLPNLGSKPVFEGAAEGWVSYSKSPLNSTYSVRAKIPTRRNSDS